MNSDGTTTASHSGILPWKVPRISSIRNTAANPNAEARRRPSLRPMKGDRNPPKMPKMLNTSAPIVA
ncbi:hypothetical protein D9M69_639510 [compost metagenome]